MSIPLATDLRELVRTPSDSDTILRTLTLKALYTAVVAATGDSSITTAAISTGSATEQQLIALLGELHRAGYDYTLSASSFTVTFQR
jgi:hypothetical protein